MAVCALTKKSWMNGNRVSHSNIKTKRKLKANVQNKRVFDVETGKFVRLKICTRALRTLNKKPLMSCLSKVYF
jgi:large subunit ribosomal protein L28